MQKHSKIEMCHFLVPEGQPKMMHKNFMHRHLRIFLVRRSGMKFYVFQQMRSMREGRISMS